MVLYQKDKKRKIEHFLDKIHHYTQYINKDICFQIISI